MKKELLLHLLLWAFVYALTFDSFMFDYGLGMAALLSFVECAINALISYVNLKILIPKVLEKRGLELYTLSVVAFFLLLFVPYYFSDLGTYLLSFSTYRIAISFTLNFIVFILLSFLFWKVNKYELEKKRNLALSNQKLEAELLLLKSQVSPHFLFNTLNNIYSLSVTKHDNAPLMIEKLSDLLRYIIYEGKEEFVPLAREVELLRNYVELQQLKRPKGGKNIRLIIQGSTDSQYIAPLILINIVENCFKHGDIAHNVNAILDLSIEVMGDGLRLNTRNSYTPKGGAKKGVGLINVRQQLQHYYPYEHEIKLDTSTGLFEIDLAINLKR